MGASAGLTIQVGKVRPVPDGLARADANDEDWQSTGDAQEPVRSEG